MEGPNDETRAWIAEEALRLAEAGQAGEDDQWLVAELAGLLEALARAISDDVGVEGEVAVDLESATYVLDAVQMWASATSYALVAVYAPASPLPRRLAGFANSVTEKTQVIAGILLAPLKAAAAILGADSYAIGLSFPWGVSVELGWST